jgi:hypothetical protein
MILLGKDTGVMIQATKFYVSSVKSFIPFVSKTILRTIKKVNNDNIHMNNNSGDIDNTQY